MYEISESALQGIESYWHRKLAGDFARSLQNDFPKPMARRTDAETLQLVNSELGRARRLGIIEQRDFQRFLELHVICEWNYPANPKFAWIGAELSGHAFDPAERLERVYQRLTLEVGA